MFIVYMATSDLSGLPSGRGKKSYPALNQQGRIQRLRMQARHKWMPRKLRIQQRWMYNFPPSRRAPSKLLLGSSTHANSQFGPCVGLPGARPNFIQTFPPSRRGSFWLFRLDRLRFLARIARLKQNGSYAIIWGTAPSFLPALSNHHDLISWAVTSSEARRSSIHER